MSTRKNTLARTLAAVGALAAAAAVATAAHGQSIFSTGQSFVSAALLPGRAEVDGTRLAGVALAMEPGWKTYWRAPGEAGVPPRFDWSGSTNLASAEVFWPRPIVFESFGMRTVGYAGTVVLPVRLVPMDPSRPIGIRLGLQLGVCKDVCIFEETALSAEMPVGLEAGAAEVAAAFAAVPGPGPEAGIGPVTCRIEGAGSERRFSAGIALAAPATDPVVILEGPGDAWFHDVTITEAPTRLGVEAALGLGPDSAWIGRDDIRITLLAGEVAADIRGCDAPDG